MIDSTLLQNASDWMSNAERSYPTRQFIRYLTSDLVGRDGCGRA